MILFQTSFKIFEYAVICLKFGKQTDTLLVAMGKDL